MYGSLIGKSATRVNASNTHALRANLLKYTLANAILLPQE